MRSWRLPPDFATVRAWLAAADVDVQLIVCVDRAVPSTMLPAPIGVPSLSTRASDLLRIIDEYALDALAVLGAPATSFGLDDHVPPAI